MTHLLSGDNEYISKWKENPIFTKMEHALTSTDETSKIAELVDTILSPWANPVTPGRELCTVAYTDQERVKVRLGTRGRAVQSGKRGVWNIQSTGASNEFKEIPMSYYLQNRSDFDRTAVEDMSPYQMTQQNMNAVDSMRVGETQIILDKYKEERGNGIRITKGSGNGEVEDIDMNLLIKMASALEKKNRKLECFVMSVASKEALLLDENLQRSDFFQGFQRDYSQSEGVFGSFLGADIISTTLCPNSTIYGINKTAMVYGIRRDMFIQPYMNQETDMSGITISHRFGLEAGRIDESLVTWY